MTGLAKVLATVTIASLLTACGGGGGSMPSGTTGGGAKTATLAVTIKVPGSSAQSHYRLRHPLYTSIDTQGIGIEYQANGGPAYTGAPNALPKFGQALNAGAPGCAADGLGDGGFNCTVYIPSVPVGYDDLRVALWNAAPTGCVAPLQLSCSFAAPGDRALSFEVLADQAIIAGISNQFSFTTLPVVDSVGVSLTGPVVDGIASSSTAFLAPKDAAGDNILSSTADQLVDASGNNLTITLGIANDAHDASDPGGACAAGAVSAASGCALYFTAPPSFTNASSTGYTATIAYDGVYAFPASSAQNPPATIPQVTIGVTGGTIGGTNQPATFAVSQTNGGVTVPAAPQYTGHAALAATPKFVASASDGQLYAIEGLAGSMTMQRFAPAAPGTVQNVTTFASNNAGGVAGGSDGYLWYTDNQNNRVWKQPTGTSGTPVQSNQLFPGTLGNVVEAPNGLTSFLDTASNFEDNMTPNGMATANANTLPNWTRQSGLGALSATTIAAGTFGNGQQAVCYSDGLHAVNCANVGIQAGGIAPTDTAGPAIAPAGNATAMAFGPDNNLYVAFGSVIYSLNLVGSTVTTVTTYALAGSGSVVNGMTLGPDNAVWFTESGGSAGNVIGRIDPSSPVTQPEEWGSSVGLPAGTTLGPILTGSDNKLWALDTGGTNNYVDQITP